MSDQSSEDINVYSLKSNNLLGYEKLRREMGATWDDINWEENTLLSGSGDPSNKKMINIVNSKPVYRELFRAQMKEADSYANGYCDVHFIVDDGIVPVHRIFFSRLNFLNSLIESGFQASTPCTKDFKVGITLEGVKIKVLTAVLSLVCTGNTIYDEDDEQEFNALMRTLQLDQLVTKRTRCNPLDPKQRKPKLLLPLRKTTIAQPTNPPTTSAQTAKLPTPESSVKTVVHTDMLDNLPLIQKVPPGTLTKKNVNPRIQRKPLKGEHPIAGTSSDPFTQPLPEVRKVPPGTLIPQKKNTRIKRGVPDSPRRTENQGKDSENSDSDCVSSPTRKSRYEMDGEYVPSPSVEEDPADEDDDPDVDVPIEEVVALESDDEIPRVPRTRNRTRSLKSKSRSRSRETGRKRYPKRERKRSGVAEAAARETDLEDTICTRTTRARKSRKSGSLKHSQTEGGRGDDDDEDEDAANYNRCNFCGNVYENLEDLIYHLDTECQRHIEGLYDLRQKYCKTCDTFFATYNAVDFMEHVRVCVCAAKPSKRKVRKADVSGGKVGDNSDQTQPPATQEPGSSAKKSNQIQVKQEVVDTMADKIELVDTSVVIDKLTDDVIIKFMDRAQRRKKIDIQRSEPPSGHIYVFENPKPAAGTTSKKGTNYSVPGSTATSRSTAVQRKSSLEEAESARSADTPSSGSKSVSNKPSLTATCRAAQEAEDPTYDAESSNPVAAADTVEPVVESTSHPSPPVPKTNAEKRKRDDQRSNVTSEEITETNSQNKRQKQEQLLEEKSRVNQNLEAYLPEIQDGNVKQPKGVIEGSKGNQERLSDVRKKKGYRPGPKCSKRNLVRPQESDSSQKGSSDNRNEVRSNQSNSPEDTVVTAEPRSSTSRYSRSDESSSHDDSVIATEPQPSTSTQFSKDPEIAQKLRKSYQLFYKSKQQQQTLTNATATRIIEKETPASQNNDDSRRGLNGSSKETDNVSSNNDQNAGEGTSSTDAVSVSPIGIINPGRSIAQALAAVPLSAVLGSSRPPTQMPNRDLTTSVTTSGNDAEHPAATLSQTQAEKAMPPPRTKLQTAFRSSAPRRTPSPAQKVAQPPQQTTPTGTPQVQMRTPSSTGSSPFPVRISPDNKFKEISSSLQRALSGSRSSQPNLAASSSSAPLPGPSIQSQARTNCLQASASGQSPQASSIQQTPTPDSSQPSGMFNTEVLSGNLVSSEAPLTSESIRQSPGMGTQSPVTPTQPSGARTTAQTQPSVAQVTSLHTSPPPTGITQVGATAVEGSSTQPQDPSLHLEAVVVEAPRTSPQVQRNSFQGQVSTAAEAQMNVSSSSPFLVNTELDSVLGHQQRQQQTHVMRSMHVRTNEVSFSQSNTLPSAGTTQGVPNSGQSQPLNRPQPGYLPPSSSQASPTGMTSYSQSQFRQPMSTAMVTNNFGIGFQPSPGLNVRMGARTPSPVQQVNQQTRQPYQQLQQVSPQTQAVRLGLQQRQQQQVMHHHQSQISQLQQQQQQAIQNQFQGAQRGPQLQQQQVLQMQRQQQTIQSGQQVLHHSVQQQHVVQHTVQQQYLHGGMMQSRQPTLPVQPQQYQSQQTVQPQPFHQVSEQQRLQLVQERFRQQEQRRQQEQLRLAQLAASSQQQLGRQSQVPMSVTVSSNSCIINNNSVNQEFGEPKKYSCDQCGCLFQSKQTLEEHFCI